MIKVRQYYIYILANNAKMLYVGVTKDLMRRIQQHKDAMIDGHTAKYSINQLVYFETTQDIRVAITREKQIKGWLRAKKIALIDSCNPEWKDLSVEWFK